MAAARIQRWALTLSAYEYKIVYREGKKNSNADALSRLPLNRVGKKEVPAEMIMLMDHMDSTPVTAQQIKAWTRKDPILGQITNYVLKGWPNYRDNDEMKPYFSRKTELSVFDSCLLWGNRVVIPNPGRKNRVQQKQQRQKQSHDKTAQVRNFNVGDSVYILSHNREAKWITGTLIKRTGPVSFVIELNDGRTVKRHQNQIRHKYDQYSDNKLPDISEIPDIPIPVVSDNQADVETPSGSSDTMTIQNPL
ncbi:unnamed protein product [Mytilus edulis]|uniref:Integrase zinc-binding domain-containing protein n=1 Tax=Mytilus edulis TaxID=6550 RepID=A0A8S3RY23_MYTED|nr:unnamed protein product [Mytilus edulis]